MSNSKDRRSNLNESGRSGNGNGSISGLGTTKVTRGLFKDNLYNRTLAKSKESAQKQNN